MPVPTVPVAVPPRILPVSTTDSPAQIVEGVAVTEVIAGGYALTVTLTVPIDVHPLSGSNAVTV